MQGNLPVSDPEYITCWENLEYSMLKLEEEQFNILLNDKRHKTKKKIVTKKTNTNNYQISNNTIQTQNNKNKIEKPIIENDFISEMEKMFESGDTKSIIDVLKSYEK